MIFYSRDHATNSYVDLQLGLQNRTNTHVLPIFATIYATGICAKIELQCQISRDKSHQAFFTKVLSRHQTITTISNPNKEHDHGHSHHNSVNISPRCSIQTTAIDYFTIVHLPFNRYSSYLFLRQFSPKVRRLLTLNHSNSTPSPTQ